MKWPPHGSNPKYLYKEIGLPIPENLLDFSANINPLGPPRAIKEKWSSYFEKVIDYPDPNSICLKEMIAAKEGVRDDCVLLGNGGAELITLIGRMLSQKNVLIIEPAFSEYEKACRTNGCNIVYYQAEEPSWQPLEEELFACLKNMGAVFLCNPNNPTGVVYSREFIVSLLDECRRNGVLLIVDEAFHDFHHEYMHLTPLLGKYENLIILRSMTKMYAIPGLRLGFVLAAPLIIQRLAKSQPHWSVNALAMEAGVECLKDVGFVEDSAEYIENERVKLFNFFENYGFAYSPSQVNFYLLRDPVYEDQYSFFEFLLRKGIVPRHTFNFPGLEGRWLRFAIKGELDNRRLLEVLLEWKELQ